MNKEETHFPLAIPSDNMIDYYSSKVPLSISTIFQILQGFKMDLYMSMVEFYLKDNLSHEPWYAVINDAESLVIDSEKQKGVFWTLQEFCIDLSHLHGYRGEEVQILAIPFEDRNTSNLFGSALSKTKPFLFWHDGKFRGDNLPDIDPDDDYKF